MTMDIIKTPLCPSCGAVVDGATQINGDAEGLPDPGDLSMCIYCGKYLLFTEGLELRLLTEAEVCDLPEHARTLLQRARDVWNKLPPRRD